MEQRHNKPAYETPTASVQQIEPYAFPIAIAGVFLYVALITIAAVELVAAAHAALVLRPKA